MTSRRQAVAAAVRDLREFHKLGQELDTGARTARAAGRGRFIIAEAKRRGIGVKTLYQARRFADPDKGYTRPELDELCALIRRYQPGQDPGRGVFRLRHVVRLLWVHPKAPRRALQRQAVEQGWTGTELDYRVTRLLGRRSGGGRRRHLPRDPNDLLAQLEGLCESWRRWRAAPGGPPDRRGDLPEPVRAALQRASRGVLQLQQAAEAALQAAHPGRAARGAARPG